MQNVLSVIILLASIAIIAAVMLQEPKREGLGAAYGGSTNIFGQSGSGKDALLNKVTIVAFIVFLVAAIAIAAIK